MQNTILKIMLIENSAKDAHLVREMLAKIICMEGVISYFLVVVLVTGMITVKVVPPCFFPLIEIVPPRG